jgi:hypothetical protein
VYDEYDVTPCSAHWWQVCDALEASAIQVAKDNSILLGPQFIAAVQALHGGAVLGGGSAASPPVAAGAGAAAAAMAAAAAAGLPWWAAIAAVNMLARTAMLPVIIASQRATSRMMVRGSRGCDVVAGDSKFVRKSFLCYQS